MRRTGEGGRKRMGRTAPRTRGRGSGCEAEERREERGEDYALQVGVELGEG